MAAPVCPRCRSADAVVLGLGGCSPFSWACLRCWLKVRQLDRAVLIWRLWEELDRITREAA